MIPCALKRDTTPPKNRPSARVSTLGVVASLLVALILGGLYLVRERSSIERDKVIQLARSHSPDAASTLAAHFQRHSDDEEIAELLVAWHLRAKSPFSEFEPVLDRLCALRPNDPNPLRTRTYLRAHHGRPKEAVADGLRALELANDDHATRRLVVLAAADAKQFDVAIREARKLLESSPVPRTEAGTMLVKAYLQAGDVIRAEETLEACFPITQASEERDALRAQIMQAAGRHAEAVALFRHLADQSPRYRESALYHLAKSQASLGREEDARASLDELETTRARKRLVVDAAQQPDNLEVQLRAAEALLSDGKTLEAAALVEQAILRLGKDPAATRLLAAAYRRLGRHELAAQWDRAASP
jgi:tetratricopeptide (TPR) repeat protein